MQRTLFDLTHRLTEFNVFEFQGLEDIQYISHEQENKFRHFVAELIVSIDCLPLQEKKFFSKCGILDHPWIEPSSTTLTRIAKMRKVPIAYVIQRFNALNDFLENRMISRGFRYYGHKLNINDVIIEMKAFLQHHESFDINFTTSTAKQQNERKLSSKNSAIPPRRSSSDKEPFDLSSFHPIQSKCASLSNDDIFHLLQSQCEKNFIPKELIPQMMISILSFIRTGLFKPILLTGNPGVGKTFFASTLSKILGIPLHKISAVASSGRGIVGDSRSYNSSAPGELVQGILTHKTTSLVVLVDEIDKAASQSRGNVHNIPDELLCALDGSRQIHDLYQEQDISTADMCFILTCNELSLINPYLRDRCLVIHFPDPDKSRIINILKKYINNKTNNEPFQNRIFFPETRLSELVDFLYNQHQTSLRQYNASVDKIIDDAFFHLLSFQLESYEISDEDIKTLNLTLPNKKRFGFEL